MIEIKGLTKRFGKIIAVDRLTLDFDKGIIGLVGHNGAGKSTLLRMVAGVYKPDEGEISVDGFDEQSKEAKSKIFFLPDDLYVPSGLTLKNFLEFYLCLFELDEAEFNRLINEFGLPQDEAVSDFSKGMKRQAFIALALSSKGDYLLLDEAFDGLDPVAMEVVKSEILKASEKGKTIVVSSHNIYALQRIADRFVILTKGKIGKEGEALDIGTEFVKFQAAFKEEINEESLAKLGLNLILFRKIGSVCNFVIIADESVEQVIREKLKPVFLEKVPMDPDELVTLEMLAVKKRGEKDA